MFHEVYEILKSDEDLEIKNESLENFSNFLKEKENDYKKEHGIETKREVRFFF